ncbi:transglutaminaseTgpA domain-containing protein [Georgenia faecalis]|uniref:transglutaminaseTgpA domain-containing protein n=1 Tax=Georgenia faecalis TaxID=2483799 RepID=UPI000FD6EA9F|nr:transglutaminaseTgpA domain-containing protein [Georgenia faecalis]
MRAHERARWDEAVLAALATFAAAWPITALVRADPWIAPLVVVLAVVVVVGSLARALRVPGWAVVTLQAGATALVVAWTSLGEHLWFGLPGPDALAEAVALLREGASTIRTETVPAPATAGLVLLVLAGVAVVALVVDAVGVTGRAPALAGVPLLLTSAITASNTGEPLHPRFFLVPALAWLLLLGRHGTGRVRAWARAGTARTSVDVPAAVAGGAQRHSSTARWVGAVTLLAAVAVPAALPHLPPTALVDGLGRAGAGGGTGQVTFTETLDLAADLASRSTAPVIRYRSAEGSVPPLRVTVSTMYEAGQWWPSEREAATTPAPQVPAPAGLDPGLPLDTGTLTVIENGLRSPQVAVPHPLVGADFGEIPWGVDPATQTAVIAGQADSYEVSYLRMPALALPETVGEAPPRPGLPDAVVDDPFTTHVDPASEERVEALTAEVVGDLTNEVEIARAIQDHLRGPLYTYSLTLAEREADGPPIDPISHFLVTRQGYCTQFATAMVMMARASGIPARLAVGFLPGTTSEDGTRTIVAADAHAWPELFITGLGWTRFEPTPAQRSGPAPVYVTPGGDVATPAPDPTAGADAPSAAPGADAGATPPPGGAPAWVGDVLAWAGATLGVLAVIALAASVVPAAGRWRRESWRRTARTDGERVEGEWHLLTTSLADLGVPAPAGTTVRQARAYYARAADLDPSAAAALTRVTERVEASRYAAAGAPAGTIADDVARVIDRRAAALPPRERWAARLWPRSGVEQLRSLARAVTAAGTRVGAGLRRRRRTT